MKILLENNQILDEGVMFEQNMYRYGSVFNKINVYTRRAKVAAMNESKYFRSKYSYNPDIMFNIEEQDAIRDMLIQMRAHLYEQMELELANYQASAIMEGVWDNIKNSVNKGKKWLSDKYEEVSGKFKNAIKLIEELIESGINSVKDLMKSLGELFMRLGDSLSEAIAKLGGFTKDDTAEDAEGGQKAAEVFTKDIPSEQKTFFNHVVEYINDLMSNNPDKAKKMMNEGFVDKVANNKFLQFVIGHRKGKRWGWWHTILVSLVGSFIVSVILPMVLYVFGVTGAAAAAICTAVAIVWQARGLIKVLLNRYLNKKPGEPFFNFWTCLGIFLAVVPTVILRIPWVQEHLQEAVRAAFHALGLDKVIDNIEDWLAKIVEHFSGHNPTDTVTVESGKWVEEQVLAIRNSGTAHVELMGSGGAHNYINSLFSGHSDLNDFTGNAGEIKTWMETIADAHYTSSLNMLHNLPSLSGDAPLTAVLDGNTFGHVSRKVLTKAIEKYAEESGVHMELVNVSNDALRDSTKNMAGTAYALVMDGNATSENASIMNGILGKVAKEVGAKATAGYNAFGTVINTLKDTATVWHDSIVNHEVTHHLFDTIVQCFNPMFLPWFVKDKWGDYMLRLGSNASGYPAYVVTEVKNMKLEDVAKLDNTNKAIPLLIKHLEDVQKQHKNDLEQGIKQEKEENDGKVSKKSRSFFKREVKKYNDNSDMAKKELMVIFVSGNYIAKDKDGKKVKKELKNQPAVVFDMNTMMCADIAPWFNKRRNLPYFMKGLFSKLDFIPTKKDDNETKEFIHEMLNKTIETGCKQCVSFGTGNMYIKKDGDKYVPTDESKKDEKFFDIGNLTSQELCDVLNGTIEGYSLLDGKYGEIVSMKTDKDGQMIKKSRENKRVIEKKRYVKLENGKFKEDKNGEYDFVDAIIIPFISKENSAVNKELKNDKEVAELIFDEDGNIDTDIITDPTLNLKQFLFRPAKTFGKEDKVKLAEGINKYLKGKNKKEKLEAYNTAKRMIEIIWRNMYENIRRNVQRKTSQLQTSEDEEKMENK